MKARWLGWMICMVGTLVAKAQVTDVKYIMQYDCDSNYYEVKIGAMEGDATSVLHRAQFNSQISIAVPTGKVLVPGASHMPLVDNQNYEGTEPTTWIMMSPVYAPAGNDGYDFYSFVPQLSPASFFNDMIAGGEYMLFTFKIEGDENYDPMVRFYNNAEDTPKSNYDGADLRNGYSLGGATNRYTGNIHRSCTTSTDQGKPSDVKIYPNPSSTRINIESPVDTQSIQLMDSTGRKIRDIKKAGHQLSSVSVEHLKAGIYYIQLTQNDQIATYPVAVQ